MKIILLLVVFWAAGAFGQSCSTTNPCAPVQVGGPVGSVATLLVCGGTCTAAQLNAYLANPTAPSPWSVAASFTQKAAIVDYNDPRPYGTQISYAAYNTPSGGVAGAPSAISTFQFPAAPPITTLTVGPNIVTTGTVGPQ